MKKIFEYIKKEIERQKMEDAERKSVFKALEEEQERQMNEK